MVWVLLVLAAVSWVVVSLIRVGEGDAATPGGAGRGARLPVGKDRSSSSPRLAPTIVEVLGTARTWLGPATRTFGRALARDCLVARAVAADGLRGIGHVASLVRRRRRGEVVARATWYEVTERPWPTRISGVIQLAMLVTIAAVLVAGAVTLAALAVARIVGG